MPLHYDHLDTPVAPTKDHQATHHGDTISDPYHWLKDQDYPEVKDPEILAYLKQENDYYKKTLGAHQETIDDLFEEIKSRIPEVDNGVPYRDGSHMYQWRFTQNSQYRQWYRKLLNSENWQLFLDENTEAKDTEFFKLGMWNIGPENISPENISPGKTLLAWSADKSGGERYDVFCRSLLDHNDAGDNENSLERFDAKASFRIAENRSPEIIFSTDARYLVSVELSSEWRPFKVTVTNVENLQTEILYEERDPSFFVHITATSDKKWLIIKSADHVTAECRAIALDDLFSPAQLFPKRSVGHDYDIDHDEQGFIIRSNRDHQNFSLYRADHAASKWRMLLAGDDKLYLREHLCFKDFTAVAVRHSGQDGIYILKSESAPQPISFEEAVFEVNLGTNADFKADFVRAEFSSLITPPSILDIDAMTGHITCQKRQTIPSGYTRQDYRTERLIVPARDGVGVPVSLVYKKDWRKGGYLHLYGYGAYGLGMSPSFSAARLSLLDRGFAFAIAHIRGGDEMGQAWYQAGKLKNRENTFHDFVDSAKYLQNKGYCAPETTTISGGSAGGELIGAALNEAKELFKAAVLHVPFVDVLNTMLDSSLPLTPIEWPEWGNPIEDKESYFHIKGYCPYTNMDKGAWPAIFVTGGLNDPRVTYWEPAKYVAKLRTLKQDNTPCLMKINMTAGHKGKSGRFDSYREVAEEYCFLLLAVM